MGVGPRPSEASSGAGGRPAGNRSVSLSVAIGIALACVLVGLFGGYSLGLSHTRQAREEALRTRLEIEKLARAHEKLQERTWMLFLQTQETTNVAASPTTPLEPGVYGDGTYRVGTEIEPGTYRGTVIGEVGYWARLRSLTGLVSAIEANDIVRGPFVLTILPSDKAVELRRVILTAEE